MKRDSTYGAALIFGAVAGVVTMALHPTGSQLLADFQRTAPMVLAVHALALAGVPITFFGAIGIVRRLSASEELALSGLVAYGFASIAVMCAAIASGLIGPELAERVLASSGSDLQRNTALFHYNGQVNQAFAKVFVVASSVAIVLWSTAIARKPAFPRGAGVLGLIIGTVSLVLLIGLHIRLDVHGFGLVVLMQSAWMTTMGVLLLRSAEREPAALR